MHGFSQPETAYKLKTTLQKSLKQPGGCWNLKSMPSSYYECKRKLKESDETRKGKKLVFVRIRSVIFTNFLFFHFNVAHKTVRFDTTVDWSAASQASTTLDSNVTFYFPPHRNQLRTTGNISSTAAPSWHNHKSHQNSDGVKFVEE